MATVMVCLSTLRVWVVSGISIGLFAQSLVVGETDNDTISLLSVAFFHHGLHGAADDICVCCFC